MRTLILAALTLIATQAFAETMNLEIKGMTCGACVKAVKGKICQMPGIESCKVEVGSASLKLKEGAKVEEKALTEAIREVGFSLEKVSSQK